MDPQAPAWSGAEIDPLHPHHLVIHGGYTYLQSRLDGSVGVEPEEGLFDFDTRILSWYRIRIAGQEPTGVAAPSRTNDRWQAIQAIRADDGDPRGPKLPQDAIELATWRRVGLGLDERWRITNHSMERRPADVELEIGADFRDLAELGGERRQTGRIRRAWDERSRTLQLLYTVEHDGRRLERGVRISFRDVWLTPTIEPMGEEAPPDEVRVRFCLPLTLDARQRIDAGLVVGSLVDGRWRMPRGEDGTVAPELLDRDRRVQSIRATRPLVEARDRFVPAIVHQAADDLLGLRNWDLESADQDAGWLVNAGVPEFTGLFGRDSLTAGFQAAMLGVAPLQGALEWVAATQGRVTDDEREEQPGRLVHEMRRGPLADLGIRPHRRYYGSHTTNAMFLLALSEHWHWAGDRKLVTRLRATAESAMAWAAQLGDLDGDGLLEYVQRSAEGLKNQGWKDSDEAIRYPDGRIVPNPVATVEEQGFYFIALQRWAEILVALGEGEAADAVAVRAEAIRELVEARYWLEDEGFYALALDPDGEPVRTIASNPLHLLAVGLPGPERARRVADRLMSPDLFTGWGVRTLSRDHPSYNPFGYHLGAVWPVENATFAVGCKRYGFDDLVDRIATGLYGAAGHCHRGRLPEVFAGHGQDESDYPVTYPGAKSPQAWSASATIQVLQAMLGIQPFAPAGLLGLIRPRLPEWLPEVTIRRVRVGEAVADLRFERQSDGSAEVDVDVLEGGLRALPMPPPNAESESARERLAAAVLAHLPGDTARMMRLAMGVR